MLVVYQVLPLLPKVLPRPLAALPATNALIKVWSCMCSMGRSISQARKVMGFGSIARPAARAQDAKTTERAANAIGTFNAHIGSWGVVPHPPSVWTPLQGKAGGGEGGRAKDLGNLLWKEGDFVVEAISCGVT